MPAGTPANTPAGCDAAITYREAVMTPPSSTAGRRPGRGHERQRRRRPAADRAAVVWVLARQVQLARVKPRLLLLAPLVLAFFGIRSLPASTWRVPADLALLAVSAALSLGLGVWRGQDHQGMARCRWHLVAPGIDAHAGPVGCADRGARRAIRGRCRSWPSRGLRPGRGAGHARAELRGTEHRHRAADERRAAAPCRPAGRRRPAG